jgi:hypothetical protein
MKDNKQKEQEQKQEVELEDLPPDESKAEQIKAGSKGINPVQHSE